MAPNIMSVVGSRQFVFCWLCGVILVTANASSQTQNQDRTNPIHEFEIRGAGQGESRVQ